MHQQSTVKQLPQCVCETGIELLI